MSVVKRPKISGVDMCAQVHAFVHASYPHGMYYMWELSYIITISVIFLIIIP